MAGKIVTTAVNSVFKQLVAEIVVDEIPTKYIDKIIIFYADDSHITVKGKELAGPVDVKCAAGSVIEKLSHKKIESYKLYVDLLQVEIDVSNKMYEIFGDFFG